MRTLVDAAGEWTGSSTLQDPTTGKPETVPSTLTVTPLMDGRFVRLDYTWSYQGQPQSGSLLVGHRRKKGVFTAHWIDSWHNGDAVMTCEGPDDGQPSITVIGRYPAPPGPDWGWRTSIQPGDGTLAIVMHNIWPEGKEELAVEARYTRR